MRAYPRVVLAGALYKNNVLRPKAYVQIVRALATTSQPCLCRLKALQALVGFGDKRAVEHPLNQDVDSIGTMLRKTDSKGRKIWELQRADVCDAPVLTEDIITYLHIV